MNLHEHADTDIMQHDILAQEQALTALLERVMNAPLAPLRSTLDELRERLNAVEQANAKALRSTEVLLADEIKDGSRKVSGRINDINNFVRTLQDDLDELAAALKRHDANSGERGERAAAALSRSQELVAALDVRSGDGAVTTARSLERLGSILTSLREQEQAGAGRPSSASASTPYCLPSIHALQAWPRPLRPPHSDWHSAARRWARPSRPR
jgi:hypothetical protein